MTENGELNLEQRWVEIRIRVTRLLLKRSVHLMEPGAKGELTHRFAPSYIFDRENGADDRFERMEQTRFEAAGTALEGLGHFHTGIRCGLPSDLNEAQSESWEPVKLAQVSLWAEENDEPEDRVCMGHLGGMQRAEPNLYFSCRLPVETFQVIVNELDSDSSQLVIDAALKLYVHERRLRDDLLFVDNQARFTEHPAQILSIQVERHFREAARLPDNIEDELTFGLPSLQLDNRASEHDLREARLLNAIAELKGLAIKLTVPLWIAAAAVTSIALRMTF